MLAWAGFSEDSAEDFPKNSAKVHPLFLFYFFARLLGKLCSFCAVFHFRKSGPKVCFFEADFEFHLRISQQITVKVPPCLTVYSPVLECILSILDFGLMSSELCYAHDRSRLKPGLQTMNRAQALPLLPPSPAWSGLPPFRTGAALWGQLALPAY